MQQLNNDQIAWAAEMILKAICERIKRNRKNGVLNMADSYIASLLLKNEKQARRRSKCIS